MISFSKNNSSFYRHKPKFDKSGEGKGKLKDGNYVADPDSAGSSLVNMVAEGVDAAFMKNSYRINPWIRAIVDKIVARVDSVDIYPQPIDFGSDAPKKASRSQKKHIESIMKLFTNPNDLCETFGAIKRKMLKDVLIYDNGEIEIVKNSTEDFELYCNGYFEYYKICELLIMGTSKNFHLNLCNN